MKRRQPILLVELLISLLIMGLVLEMVFLGYRQALRTKQKLYVEKEAVFGRQRLLLRLGPIFRTLQSCQKVQDGWLLRYEGGMDHNPSFRGALEALLYIKADLLILISWPQEGLPRIETLYEDKNLTSISFSFFNSNTGTFQSSFPETQPFMMKMSLHSSLTLPFFL